MGQRITRFMRFRTNTLNNSDVKELTAEELKELKEVWQSCKESSNIGEKIMLKLVHRRPEFGYFFGLDSSRPNNHTTIPLQGVRLERFFDMIFLALTHSSKVESLVTEQCRRVGSIHFCRRVNLVNDDWLEFGQIVVEVVVCEYQKYRESYNNTDKLKEQWKQLLTKLIVEVKNGYEKERLTSRTLTPSCTRRNRFRTPTMRHRRSSAPSYINYGEPAHLVLSPLEHEAVKLSWEDTSLYREIGMELVIRMIVDKPAYGGSLGVDGTKEVALLWVDPNVRMQGHRIHIFLETIINLYDTQTLEKLREMCHRVGAVHFNRNVNFTADIWVLLKRGIIEIVTGAPMSEFYSLGSRHKNDLVVGAWEKLLRWIIKEIKKGFCEQAQQSGTKKLKNE